MFNTLYAQQEYFGLKSWTDLAAAAGISDLVAFDACIGRQELPADILSGKELATDLGLHGTPTLIINGWVLGHTPRFQEPDAAVKHVLAGHDLSSYLAPKSWFGWLRN